jgi:hypothetical protein
MADLDMIHCRGTIMGQLIESAKDDIRLVQFTGSAGVAEHLAEVMNGAVRLEDAGFDWKVLGPDYDPEWLDYVMTTGWTRWCQNSRNSPRAAAWKICHSARC